jgi:hypothetical protein
MALTSSLEHAETTRSHTHPYESRSSPVLLFNELFALRAVWTTGTVAFQFYWMNVGCGGARRRT